MALETVEDIGIGNHIASRKGYMGKVLGPDEACGLLAQVDGILQESEFRTFCVIRLLTGCRIRRTFLRGEEEGRVGGDTDFFLQRQTTQLAKQHLCQ